MTNTSNYNLLLAEGTDLVNYLTQTNPNFSNLDTIIKGVSDATITPATEVTVGMAHALTRSLPDCPVIRFTATSNWTTGDTISVDGTNVTALKTDGTTLKTGDYIIGSEVIAVLQSTRLTVFVSSAAPVNASQIVYDNTDSGLTANDVQGAIDEIAEDMALTYPTYSYTVPSAGRTFTLTPGTRLIINTLTTSDTLCGIIYVYVYGSGYVVANKIGAPSVTITTDTNTLILQGSLDFTAYVTVYAGSVSTT